MFSTRMQQSDLIYYTRKMYYWMCLQIIMREDEWGGELLKRSDGFISSSKQMIEAIENDYPELKLSEEAKQVIRSEMEKRHGVKLENDI